MKRALILACLCLFPVLIPGCNREIQAQQAIEFQLENGLKVRLLPLPTAKTNTLVVLYDVGNRNDPKGKSGMAHMSEHLYVTAATENMKSRNVQEYMSAYPDGWNAQTGDDYTVIATVFKPEQMDDEISDAADRMQKIVVDQSDLDRELPRIDNELQNMYEGFPQLAVANHGRHYSQLLPNDGRRGGKIENLKTVSVAEMQDWLDQYYKPNNAMLILAGAFDEDSARKTITEKFGAIQPGNEPETFATPTATDQRTYEVDLQVVSANPTARVGFTFRAPKPDDPLYAAFLVHTTRMQISAMNESRNKSRNKKTGGMPDMPFMFRPVDDPGFFYVSSNVNRGESNADAVKRLETMLDEHLNTALKKHHITTTSGQMAMFLGTKNLPAQMMAMNTYGNAFALGRREQMGLDGTKLAKQLESVDAEQMTEAIKKFFGEANRITVIGTPKK